MKPADAILPGYRNVHTGATAEAFKIGAWMIDRKEDTVTLLPAVLEAPHIEVGIEFFYNERAKQGDYFVREGGKFFCLDADIFEGSYMSLPGAQAGVA